MKIELLENARFTTSGSSVLKMMQNNSVPAIDLIVRESIQNSTDAAIPGVEHILMSFTYNDFCVDELAVCFDSIGDQIKNRYGCGTAKFLAIKDSNTVGLTGNLNGEFGPGEKNQNLGKLVYHIMKAQDAEGAGGSWGIGKTVYYRVGAGLVIYYSRIKIGDVSYQERLVAALVEDETKANGLLSRFGSNQGVAFFGEGTGDGKVTTIIDEAYIHSFLRIFGLPPFDGPKTGTVIIIPFIDEDGLLKSNSAEGEAKNWWETSLEQYLKVSIHRWYFPRMCQAYPKKYGPNLTVLINGSPLTTNEETLVFAKFDELYRACYEDSFPPWIKKITIERERRFADKVIGYFAYGKVTKDELEIISKHFPIPYAYTLTDNNGGESNSPIIAFTRKPGMVVNYATDGPAIGSLCCQKDEYIIGVFSLNSANSLQFPAVVNLDEYIRQSEKSDHMSWIDHEISRNQQKIWVVRTIYSGIKEELNKAYGEARVITGEGVVNRGFAKRFGKLLMPDESFGNSGSGRTQPSKGGRGGGGTMTTRKKNTVEFVDRKYQKDSLCLEYQFSLVSKVRKITAYCSVNTMNGVMSVTDYEENGLAFPFEIAKTFVLINGGSYAPPKMLVNGERFGFFEVKFLTTAMNKVYGIELIACDSAETLPFSFAFRTQINCSSKTVQMHFDFDIEEAN